MWSATRRLGTLVVVLSLIVGFCSAKAVTRIIDVADTFDATMPARPYQAAPDFSKALFILQSLVVKKCDPQVVEAICTLYEQGKLAKYEVHRQSVIEVLRSHRRRVARSNFQLHYRT